MKADEDINSETCQKFFIKKCQKQYSVLVRLITLDLLIRTESLLTQWPGLVPNCRRNGKIGWFEVKHFLKTWLNLSPTDRMACESL